MPTLQVLGVLLQSLCIPVDLEGLVFLVCSSLLALTLFLPPLPQSSLCLEGETFDEDILYRDAWSKVSFSLHNAWLWVSVFAPSAVGGSFSDVG